MRRLSGIVTAAVLALAGCAPSIKNEAGNPLVTLAGLYNAGRYFELRDSVEIMRANPSVEMEFFRGAVDGAFNRLEASIGHLSRYLIAASSNPQARSLAKEALILLSDAYRREGRYGDAAETLRSALARFRPAFSEKEKGDVNEQISLWGSLAGVPPQAVDFRADTVIRMERRNFPLTIGGRTFPFGYDTGSNLSIIYKSAADEIGIRTHGGTTRVQTSTGVWIDGRVGVVPEMTLGEVRVRNAVFVVLPDEMFADLEPGHPTGRKGLLGAPVLVGLGEFTETRDGQFIIPRSPPPRIGQNLCFIGFLPVVDVIYRGVHLPFCLDTGASSTYLYPTFYRRYGGEIKSRTRPRKSTLGAVGNSLPVTYYLMRAFAFRTGGLDLELWGVAVHTRFTNTNTSRFYGTLGLDILAQCSRLTVNTASMSFVLE